MCFCAPCPICLLTLYAWTSTCYFHQQWTKLNCITFPSKQHHCHQKLFRPSVRIPHHHLELKNRRVGVASFPFKTEQGDEVAGIKPEKDDYFQHIRSLFFRGRVIGPFIAQTQTPWIGLRYRLNFSLKYIVYKHSLYAMNCFWWDAVATMNCCRFVERILQGSRFVSTCQRCLSGMLHGVLRAWHCWNHRYKTWSSNLQFLSKWDVDIDTVHIYIFSPCCGCDTFAQF